MKYLEFLKSEETKHLLIINNCSETIKRYNLYKSHVQEELRNLPADVNRSTEYAKKYNQFLYNKRFVCNQTLSEYDDVIEFEQQQINDARESLLKIQEEMDSIIEH